MTEDALILLLLVATRIACKRMTPQHLDALHASVEQASCLSARHDAIGTAITQQGPSAVTGAERGSGSSSIRRWAQDC